MASDTFIVDLLRSDNTVFVTNSVVPGAWAGAQTFRKAYFSYVGDGTSDLRIRLKGGNSPTRFAGAIDNVSFEDSQPVPAPGAAALVGLAGLVAGRRRRN